MTKQTLAGSIQQTFPVRGSICFYRLGSIHLYAFRPCDVGKSKAVVAAERVMERVRSVAVVPHNCMIQEKDIGFYEQFHVIVLGLDSLEARQYMNAVACSFLRA